MTFGEAYLLSGQLPKAQESLNQALRLKPDSADTLYLLAETLGGDAQGSGRIGTVSARAKGCSEQYEHTVPDGAS